MTTRTREEVYRGLRYDLEQLSGSFVPSKTKPPTDDFLKSLGLIREVLGGRTDLNSHEINILTTAGAQAESSGVDARAVAQYKETVLQWLPEIRTLPKEASQSDIPAPAKKRQEKCQEVYVRLQGVLEGLTTANYFSDYSAVSQKFPEPTKLIKMVVVNRKTDLNIGELDLISELPALVRASDIQGKMKSALLADFEKRAIPLIKEIQSLKVEYTPAEDQLITALDAFWRTRGQALQKAYDGHKDKNNPKIDRGLRNAILLAKGMHDGPRENNGEVIWDKYSANNASIRDILLRVRKLQDPEQDTRYNVLLNTGADNLAEARLSLGSSNSTDRTIIGDASTDYRHNIMPLVSKALEAVRPISTKIQDQAVALIGMP